MKGYIYTMSAGADPGHGWILNDPIFGNTPTLGACVPNIRRAVEPGDYIFVVSGRVKGVPQFVVGGFKVSEKIDALAAFRRFPEYRLKEGTNGHVLGNVIVRSDGKQHPLDDHDSFAQRVENYIVGRDPVVFETPKQFEAAREDTVSVLSNIFERPGRKVFDVIGRHRKMNQKQIEQLLEWMRTIRP
jgi:hypothetical protein